MTRFRSQSGSAFGPILTTTALIAAGLYFSFAAINGDYGLFRRGEIEAEAANLKAELAEVRAEVVALENLTRRLSDSFLDLDLLDQQVRDILGYVRLDELVLR